jgi:PAS domain S-box-containing protein
MKNGRTKPNSVQTSHLNGETLGTEQRYRFILDSITDAVYKINPGGFFTYLNETAMRRTGLTPETYPTSHYLDLVAPEHRDLVRTRFERVMSGEENPYYELRIRGQNGGGYCVEVKSKPIFENGSVVEMLGISRDISLRKKAEEAIRCANELLERNVDERTRELQEKTSQLKDSETRYRAIFENTGTAMMIVDENAMITLVNAEFEKMSGYTRREVERNIRWPEFLSYDSVPQKTSRQNGRDQQEAFPASQFECQAVDKYGQIRDIMATTAEIPGVTDRIVSLLDITERRRAMEMIRKREEDLKAKTMEMEELSTALKVLLKSREEDRRELEEGVSSNLRELVLPYLERLKKNALGVREKSRIHVIESNLKVITSPFARKLTSRLLNLTPKEIEVANFIKEGRTTKEIAEIMDVSKSAIDTHRHHIRKKLGLKNKKMNMRSYLHSLT